MSSPMLLFGASSLLGFHVATMFPHTVLPFISPGNTAKPVRQWPALQLHDSGWVRDVFHRTRPETLVYCHAVCDVPKCEADSAWAYEMNVHQLDQVIAALPECTRLVYVSSDHVFGGDGRYTEASYPSPISVYGQTRVEAEQQVLKRSGALIIRVGLGIGGSPNGRTGHLDWLRYRTKHNLPITIIEDEYRSTVWQRDLAKRVMHLAQSDATGIRHIASGPAVSRVELAKFLIRKYEIGSTFTMESRHQQGHPHLGHVELATLYDDQWAKPLSSVVAGPSH